LWITDAISNGTFLVKDINPGINSSLPQNYFVFNNLIFFTAENSEFGQELWLTDGTRDGTVLLEDIKLGSDSSNSL